eukprot:TRINITY_DN43629_c0_g1_i7.p1 TRINITY_DN43629_c0_g1~~TRINITY_DN43629_c0_g1_i7.p1  ORF type:complete len:425 (+),score=66.07 TRINITY_DN43629_c0_g1_i7:117-1391(+)
MEESRGIPRCRTWNFNRNAKLESVTTHLTISGTISKITANLDHRYKRPTIPLARGDPSHSPCFRTTPIAEDAIISAVRSAQFNSYAPRFGLLPARRAIAEYLSRDLPCKLSPDDVFLTVGCKQAIKIVISALALPRANILLPRPAYPFYDSYATQYGVEARYCDLIPERNWEIDLDSVESVADENTVAIVIINPGNPCGNVFTYEQLAKVAETARDLGILVISDEVYGHLTFGNNPFVPMGVFGSVVPVITVGSISKRWVVPGWRLGWLVTCDHKGILKEAKIVDHIKNCRDVSSSPATFIQGAIPQILGNTSEDFFNKTIELLKQAADICYERIKEIDCITCPCKPEGSMFVMVKMNLSLLEDILDDLDFCCKLAKEESVVILPGSAVGWTNWLRITFAIEPSSLEEGLGRLKSFCQKHAKKQ